MQRVKLTLKILASVAFAAALLLTVITFSLSEIVASAELALLTGATEYPPETAVFLSGLEQNVIRNMFWLSLAALGFCLIFLYFLAGSWQIFFAPSILALLTFSLLQIMLFISPGYLAYYMESALGPLLREGLQKAQAANFLILALGIILLLVSLYVKPGQKTRNLQD